jgi:ribosomal protein S8E
MAINQRRSVKKETGSGYKRDRSKRKAELGGLQA